MKTVGWIVSISLLGLGVGCATKDQLPLKQDNMVWISGGEFLMGSDSKYSYEHERPAHPVKVNAFWMDTTEVTNAQFKKFTEATHYVTVAERKPDWEELKKQLPADTPKPPDSILVAGSLVFNPPNGYVSLHNYAQWWSWTKGANWKSPEGGSSALNNRWDHPVVHVAYEDAQAYCTWAGKRLPTEAEWEFAAQGTTVRAMNADDGIIKANYFQGSFPTRNLAEDGFEGTAPVASFEANSFGLYDMIGNVWEWTSDRYNVHYYAMLSTTEPADNPTGPEQSYDPNEPGILKYVTKGGSFLCASNYCANYRTTARQGTAFDSGMSNVGFRCVKNEMK
ncbi:MAG: formylglycine-generating enzyme family protein [Bacteroidetes bacterium CHB5]|nr:formylglycine-generating enzyme family protein [Bacteroidetes bacterium CHB5]